MERKMRRTINYCWFGGKPKSELILKCIESWKKFLPDYEIVEWNETNFDVNCCKYVQEAYESKKWAFVSVLRFALISSEKRVFTHIIRYLHIFD